MKPLCKMKKIFYSVLVLLSAFFSQSTLSATNRPELFLFLGSDPNLASYRSVLANPCVTGVQIVYPWKLLEPKKGEYDFSHIEKDIAFLNAMHKKLFIQLQDRSFQPKVIHVPDYIKNDPAYHGGVAMQFDSEGGTKPITEGWVARVWDPAVRERFQLLFKSLAMHFDGKVYGINLPETAIDLNPKHAKDFTPDNYFAAELDNIGALRRAFQHSKVVQYVNFFPGEWNNDRHYMSRLFTYAIQHQIGLGGPDVLPYRKGQMKNSYPFLHQNKTQLSDVAMAVQGPNAAYKNPDKHTHFTFADFYDFATNYLGANILFWDPEEPFFSRELQPKLNARYFKCKNIIRGK